MSAPDLRALAARCEAASGPDREIDGWIWAHLKSGEPYIIGNKPGPFPQAPVYGERADVMRLVGGKDGASYIGAPAYTASLDTAMLLASDPEFEQYGGALGLLREALDRLYRAKLGAEALARFLTAAALRAHEDRDRG